MAYTLSRLVRNIEGNKIVEYWDVTADAASGVITTGLGVVEAIAGVTPVSMATAAAKFIRNTNAASATANGSIMVSSAANGDHFIIVAVGH